MTFPCIHRGADIEPRLVGGLVVYRHLSAEQRRLGDHVPKPRISPPPGRGDAGDGGAPLASLSPVPGRTA